MGGLIAWRITISMTAPISRAVVIAEHLTGIVMNSADSARLARQLASSAASAACAPGQWRAMRIPHLGDRR